MSLINPNFSGLKVLNYLGRDAMVDCPNIIQNQIDKLYTIAKVGGYNNILSSRILKRNPNLLIPITTYSGDIIHRK